MTGWWHKGSSINDKDHLVFCIINLVPPALLGEKVDAPSQQSVELVEAPEGQLDKRRITGITFLEGGNFLSNCQDAIFQQGSFCSPLRQDTAIE